MDMNGLMIQPSTAFDLPLLTIQPDVAPLATVIRRGARVSRWTRNAGIAFVILFGIGLVGLWGWLLIQMVQMVVSMGLTGVSPAFAVSP